MSIEQFNKMVEHVRTLDGSKSDLSDIWAVISQASGSTKMTQLDWRRTVTRIRLLLSDQGLNMNFEDNQPPSKAFKATCSKGARAVVVDVCPDSEMDGDPNDATLATGTYPNQCPIFFQEGKPVVRVDPTDPIKNKK